MAANEVRQILMNELGLTREGVRAEMRDIVRDCVDRHIAQLNLAAIMDAQISKALRDGWNGSEKALREAIHRAVADKAAAIVEEAFSISITPSEARSA